MGAENGILKENEMQANRITAKVSGGLEAKRNTALCKNNGSCRRI